MQTFALTGDETESSWTLERFPPRVDIISLTSPEEACGGGMFYASAVLSGWVAYGQV